MKKTRGRRSKRKGPAAHVIAAARSLLDEMSKNGRQVHVWIYLDFVRLAFETTVDKEDKEYGLTSGDLEIGFGLELCDHIMFSPEGGLLLIRKSTIMGIDPEERSADELLAAYPGINKLIH